MLRKPQVMGVRRSSATEQTGLLGNRFDVVPVTDSGAAPERRARSYRLPWTAAASLLRPNPGGMLSAVGQIPPGVGLHDLCSIGCQGRQSRLKGLLDALGICCRKSVLFHQAPVRPDCGVLIRP